MQHIDNRDTILNFGKHKGQSFRFVAFFFPDYLIWADKRKLIEVDTDLWFKCGRHEKA